VDIVQNGTRFMQVLTGVSSTSGKGKNSLPIPAWTALWPSTTVFNSPLTVLVSAVDVFGNHGVQILDFSVQNKLVTQSGTAHVCWPSSTSCSNSVWQPVTTGVAMEAATRLQGTVSYGALSNTRSANFWLQVASTTSTGTSIYYCGTDTTTINCYPTLLLQPDNAKNPLNYSGAQIDLTSPNKNPAAGRATVNWTLTYPQ
jgi:hypothetical protein